MDKFNNSLKLKKEAEEKQACDNGMFPHNVAVSHLEERPKGTVKTRNIGLKTILEFEEICLRVATRLVRFVVCWHYLSKVGNVDTIFVRKDSY